MVGVIRDCLREGSRLGGRGLRKYEARRDEGDANGVTISMLHGFRVSSPQNFFARGYHLGYKAASVKVF
jgi:hypothetical protein